MHQLFRLRQACHTRRSRETELYSLFLSFSFLTEPHSPHALGRNISYFRPSDWNQKSKSYFTDQIPFSNMLTLKRWSLKNRKGGIMNHKHIF